MTITGQGQGIGEVAKAAGVSERTLRYYDELGLVEPTRDSAGRRRYAQDQVDRLYRVLVMRSLGSSLAEIDVAQDLLSLTSRHLAQVDRALGELARRRERVRAVEERLMRGAELAPAEMLGALDGLPDVDAPATRRLSLLVYRDIASVQRQLVDAFGFAAGELVRDEQGVVRHGEVLVGDGAVWLHAESEEFRLASPATLGRSTHAVAVYVRDVDAHWAAARAAGAEIAYEPTDMPYGVREYGARDLEGGLWCFMEATPEPPGRVESPG